MGHRDGVKQALKSFFRRLVFVDKERIGKIGCGIKVKTFFGNQYFLRTKIKKSETD